MGVSRPGSDPQADSCSGVGTVVLAVRAGPVLVTALRRQGRSRGGASVDVVPFLTVRGRRQTSTPPSWNFTGNRLRVDVSAGRLSPGIVRGSYASFELPHVRLRRGASTERSGIRW